MTPNPPPEYADKPNLWRLACELSKFKNPYKATDVLLAFTGPILKEGDHDKGGSNLTLPTKGGNQETLCLKLDFVPLWLAKISITPTAEQLSESPGHVCRAAGTGKCGDAGQAQRGGSTSKGGVSMTSDQLMSAIRRLLEQLDDNRKLSCIYHFILHIR